MTNETGELTGKWRPWAGLMFWGLTTAAVIVVLYGYFPWWLDEDCGLGGLATGVIKLFALLLIAPFVLGLIGGAFVRVDRPRKDLLLIPLAGAVIEFATVEFATLSAELSVWPIGCSDRHGFDPLSVAASALLATFGSIFFTGGAALGRLFRSISSRRSSQP